MRDPKEGDYICLNPECSFFHKATEVYWGTNHNNYPTLHCKMCKRAKIVVFAGREKAINRPINFVNIGQAEYYIKIGTVFLATRTRPNLLGRLFLKGLGISFVSEEKKELFQKKFLKNMERKYEK